MIFVKSAEEIELIRQSSLLVSKTLAEVAKHIKPGSSGVTIDKIAEDFIQSHGAKPAFKGYRGFPATLCISVNSAVVHGLPSSREFREGDVVSVDCGVLSNNYYGDSAYSFLIKPVAVEVLKLARTTYDALYAGIGKAVSGNRVGDISHAVQNYCESRSYTIVRELVGHGLGKSLHEEPDVPNYGKAGYGPTLKDNMVIAIEPMINMGKRQVKTMADGWTVTTRDGKVSMHFEHTVCIKPLKADILSDFSEVETAIKNNAELDIM